MIQNGANGGSTIVIDVGKTNAKASLWDAAGRLIARRSRANSPQQTAGYQALDVRGIDEWLIQSLKEFAPQSTVSRIVTVGHGAAATLLQENRLFAAPIDYEDEGSAADRAEYAAQRDPFAMTGSPALPCGLNLGLQLHRLEKLHGLLPTSVTIVPWPQYWSWRLCGVAASEVSSLGCHSDLWQPEARSFSPLAVRRGWAARMAPLRAAGAQLGTITREVAERTGLSMHCVVLCGMHDSNAALLAARAHSEMAGDATALSTGTWFVAMRSLMPDCAIDLGSLADARDCLVNVDVFGRPVPSARFMGGREAELISGIGSSDLSVNYRPEALMSRLPALIASGVCVYPSFVRGVGPFPNSVGQWRNKPIDQDEQRAITQLYLALMADVALDLIGSRERLLIEGHFAESLIFVRALAALRPQQHVLVSNAHQDVAYGALRLAATDLPPPCELTRVEPLEIDLTAYATQWRARAGTAGSAA
jgi:sugar (pentulose or hexulose) kinase